MRLLLDTHIWIWSVGDSDRVSRPVADELRRGSNELWLSPVSIWELTILFQKKRITLDQSLESWTANAIRALPLKEAAVTHEVAREIGRLQLPHRDLADHFLVATAKVFGLTLVTADQQLMGIKEIEILANR